ncbi:hypothetical protein [Dactylosporangium sp. CA-139066]|uniref:hypothetical protein n=1 Tax=Dactylosporangium sp. CA-139066 TaxID=3239930 RepID=UPI003D8F884D
MAAERFTFTLRLNGKRVREVDSFTRALDLDEARRTDRILLNWMVAAIERAGFDPAKMVNQFDLSVCREGEVRSAFVFAASVDEVPDAER